ncbi:MAG: hypothetical protein ACC653_01720 [Gammaproteobacteria bacterium]
MVSLDTDFTQNDKCAFSNTLITGHYSCSNATSVVRRGGNEISCGVIDASRKCENIYNKLKEIAAPVFDVDDDLLTMPHGIMVKIQHGGLLGLNTIVNGDSDNTISDISKLILATENKFNDFNDFPYESTINFMTSYKVRSRRK